MCNTPTGEEFSLTYAWEISKNYNYQTRIFLNQDQGKILKINVNYNENQRTAH